MAADVIVVGDVMVDVVALPSGPLNPGSDTPARIRTVGGGSAANTACWLAASGCDVDLVACVGDDALGIGAVAELEAAGVRFAGHRHASEPTGSCVVLVDDRGERTMLPDRGANDVLDPDATAAAITGAGTPRWMHLSGYVLLGEGSRPAGLAAIAVARERGVPWSVDAGSSAPLLAVGPERFLGWVDGCEVLFANDGEVAALGGPAAAAAVTATLVTKHGARGASWTDGEHRVAVPAPAVEVVDTVGAGDAFDAGYIAGRLDGEAPEAALRRGGEVAAGALCRWGARP